MLLLGAQAAGLAVKDSELVVVPPYRHVILGRVTTTGLSGYNKDRSGYCHISATASRWICVMGIWFAGLGYLACPCIHGHQSNDTESIELRKAALIMALQRVTAAAGGDAVVIDRLGKTATVNANTNEVLNVREMTAASGFAIRLSRALPAVDAPAAPHGPALPPGAP